MTTAAPDPMGELLLSGRLAVVDAGLRMVTARVLASDGSGWWTARLHADGWSSCDCPARRFRPRTACTHLRALLLVAPPSLRAALTDDRRDRLAGEQGGGDT